ncbi:CSC1-like protein At1g10090 [Linum perenne]
MEFAALLTSAGINIALCVLLFTFYSILRKQPSNRIVYFGRRLASVQLRGNDPFSLERFVPSTSWLIKAWETSEDEIMTVGGLDAVVFQRILVFSIRIFSIAAIICVFLLLPVNYYGKEMQHKRLGAESLDVFTIGNVHEGSIWLWAHCLALYTISCSTCVLLYFEYKSITKMRLTHLKASLTNPSYFSVLVRSIPWVPGESYSDTLKKFFSTYYPSSYFAHQMVHHSSVIQKLMVEAEKMCKILSGVSTDQGSLRPFCFCSSNTLSFHILQDQAENESVDGTGSIRYSDFEIAPPENVVSCIPKVKPYNNPDCCKTSEIVLKFSKFPWHLIDCIKFRFWALFFVPAVIQECPVAFVFFKTRYAAVVATQMLQSTNPMLWVTQEAPEPHDVLWSSLSIPYKQLWLRKIATLLAAIVFMFLFLVPVTFVQGLTQLEKLSTTFPFLTGLLKNEYVNHVVTGYLPSVILMLFLYTVPPMMMRFSAIEAPVSRSGRKKSACLNVFFVNVLSGSVISQLNVFSTVRDIPLELARAIPTQASFFMTYVFTSGWAGLACELMQLFTFGCNLFKKFVLRNNEDAHDWLMAFPYHTEIPRVLLFLLIGFTCSIMAPLILPFLLIYFFMAYLIYRNQILNVYIKKYDSGGKFWPIIHNTTVFSLVLTQIIALGVFGIKDSPVASGFTIPLIVCTLLFSEYCRQRFLPIFRKHAAQVLIDMDREDENGDRLEDIYNQLRNAYCQLQLASQGLRAGRPVSQVADVPENNSTSSVPKPVKTCSGASKAWAVCNYQES